MPSDVVSFDYLCRISRNNYIVGKRPAYYASSSHNDILPQLSSLEYNGVRTNETAFSYLYWPLPHLVQLFFGMALAVWQRVEIIVDYLASCANVRIPTYRNTGHGIYGATTHTDTTSNIYITTFCHYDTSLLEAYHIAERMGKNVDFTIFSLDVYRRTAKCIHR